MAKMPDPAEGISEKTKGWSYSGEVKQEEDKETTPSGSTSTGHKRKTTQTNKLVVKYHSKDPMWYTEGDVYDGNPPPDSEEVYSGDPKEVTLEAILKENEYGLAKRNENYPEVTYYFIGWHGDYYYDPGDTMSRSWSKGSSGTVILDFYAHFITDMANKFVYFPDSNANEKYTRSSDKQQSPSTGAVISDAIFTRKGYTQVGWSLTEGGEKYFNLNEVVSPSGQSESGKTVEENVVTVLYPVWSANTYMLTYHGNGAEQEDMVLYVTYDDEITILSESSENNRFHIDGYHLASWNDDENGEGTKINAGETYTFTRDEDTDLYAIWEGNEYTVRYRDPNSPAGTYIHESIAVYGSPFYTERIPYPEERQYSSFNGWKADDETILTKSDVRFDAYYYGESPVWNLMRDVVITRIWTPYYPLGKILYGGQYSDECGVYVSAPPSFAWPEYNYKHDEANGRNGDILRDLGRYDNSKAEYEITCYDGVSFASAAKKLSEWLHRETDGNYLKLEDSYEPDIYRLAVYEESNELENILAKAGKCKIAFNCKPQKFLYSGDKPIEIASSGETITNPTTHSSVPIIEIFGTGSVHINDSELVVLGNYNSIILDAESYDAIDKAGRSMNEFMYTEDSILLRPGENVITFSEDIEKVIITPRWWRI